MLQADLGRFNAVDPILGDSSDPQRLNRYSYAKNNPLAFADPSGLATVQVTTNCPPGSYWCKGSFVVGIDVPPNYSDKYFDPNQSGYQGGELDYAEAAWGAALDTNFILQSGFGNDGKPINTVGDCAYYRRCAEVINVSGKDGEYKCETGCGYDDKAPTADPWKPLPNNTRAVDVDGARIDDTIFKVNNYAHITIWGSGTSQWFFTPETSIFANDPITGMAANWGIGVVSGVGSQVWKGKEPTGGEAYTPFVTRNRDWCDPVHKGCPPR